MIKRTIDISTGPTFLAIENDQLVLTREREEIGRVPCEDVGVLLVDHRQTTYTHSALTRLLSHGAAIVLCGENHLPAGMLLPMADNLLLTQRLRDQVGAPVPLKKRLWRQIIRHKIRGQAANLSPKHPARRQLLDIAHNVKSGDTANAEGLAARFYWRAYFGEEFRRDPEGLPPNGLLNYGYMVFRAAIARALCAGGLHPAFGLHHSNRNNPFCLADDLVEVFRPIVDAAVLRLAKRDEFLIDKESKREILSLLTAEVTVAETSGPLMVALHRMVASLVRCYAGEQKKLDLPAINPAKTAQTDPPDGEADEPPP